MSIKNRHLGLLATACLLSACSLLPRPAAVGTDTYLLESATAPQASHRVPADAPVLLISVPAAYAAYDTPRIAYMREDYGLRFYTRSRWADVPARMLAPLLADAVQATGQFNAIHAAPASVAADMRLDTELIRFHQDFRKQPSEMRITLRARLIDLEKGRVIASWLSDRSLPAHSDDAYGGVVAANRLLGEVLAELARFCVASRP